MEYLSLLAPVYCRRAEITQAEGTYNLVAAVLPNRLRRPQDEKEATYLGGCLQIPHRGLLWAVQREMTLLQIAEHFGASKEMVLFRSNAAGIRQYVK